MLQRRMMWEVDADSGADFLDREWRFLGERAMVEDSAEEWLFGQERGGSGTCMEPTAVLMYESYKALCVP
jgi:hypothetical protein